MIPTMKKRVLLLVETSRAAGRKIIEGVSRYVIENPRWLIHLNERHISDIPSWLSRWRGDGVITRTTDHRIHDILKRKRIPRVELHGDNQDFPTDVCVDESEVAKLAADHLWNQGYRNFAFFALGNSWWLEQRRREFAEAVREYDAKSIEFEPIEVSDIYPSPMLDDRLVRKIVQWVRTLPKPAGIWAATDLFAFYVLEACLLADVNVPEEIAVLGTDNDELLCNILVPQLSSVDINAREIGYQAAHLLERRMSGEKKHTPITTPPSHVVMRQSTNIVAIRDPDVARAVSFIRENSNSPEMCVDRIAEWVGISRRTLQIKFEKHLQRTPGEELARTRIDHARRLLRDGNNKISQIAPMIGLSSTSYFFHLFQKIQGMSPRTYREMIQEKREDSTQ